MAAVLVFSGPAPQTISPQWGHAATKHDRMYHGTMLRKTSLTFADWVTVATGGVRPYQYQSRLAEQGLPDVLRVPTGTGKTLAATLPWLYRRVEHPDPVVRQATPRWLVIVLPQRALVEQTVRVIKGWLDNLGLEV
ncbi:MAG: DEAD/DEAH box helicase family protein, partial [Pseudonocardiaceae bacterium]